MSKRMPWGLSLACVWLAGAAWGAVTVTQFTGSPSQPGTATLTFDASASAREIWVGWAGEDKGGALADWPDNERVAVLAANATSATVTLPPAATGAAVGRFFLVAAGGTYPVSWIRSTSRQAIDTGVLPDYTTKAVVDVQLDDVNTTQQFVFGNDTKNDYTLIVYINGNRFWALGNKDSTGEWASMNVRPDPVRTVLTVDNPGNLFTIEQDGRIACSYTLTATRTKTGTRSLALLAGRTSTGDYSNFTAGRLFGAQFSKAGTPVADFSPVVKDGAAGVYDSISGNYHFNVGTGELYPGGRTNAVAGVASDLVRFWQLRRGDVWSDAMYIWNFDRDPNGDGAVTASDIRHALHYGTASASGWNKTPTLRDASTVGLKGLAWVTTNVTDAARGITHANATCLDFPANVQTAANGRTQTWRNGIFYSGASIARSVSLVARVLVRCFNFDHVDNSHCMIVCNGLDWANYRGCMFGFNAGSSNGNSALPLVYVGHETVYLDNLSPTLQTNRWYDVGYSIEDLGNGYAKVLMTCADVRDSSVGGTGVVYKAQFTQYGAFTNELANGASSINIGGEASGGWTDAGTGLQGAKGFNGQMRSVAMWDRALSLDELREAMVQAPGVLRIGTENDSAGEFGTPDETTDTFVYDTDPWSAFRGTLTAAKPSVTITVPMRGSSHTVPYMLRVRATSGSGSAFLKPSIGGVSLGSKILEPGRLQKWFVKPELLQSGSISLKLERTGGSGNIVLDRVEFAGSLMIGNVDNGSGEFSQEGIPRNEFVAGQWNFKRVQRAIIGSFYGATEGHINRKTHTHFWVDPELAANYRHTYSMTVVGQGGTITPTDTWVEDNGYTKNQWPFRLLMNDKVIFDTPGVANATVVSHTFEPGELKGGWNTLTWFSTGAGKYWICVDYHRLVLSDNPNGTLMFLR